MKNILSYLGAGALLLAVYYYNNPKVDFSANSEHGIQFRKDKWVTALQTAKQEKKLIFLDVYATWCGPCKKLKKYTFADAETGAYFNKNFINVSLDAEVNEGAVVSDFYQINAYPTLLFIDGEGNLIKKSTGYLNSGELLDLGKSVLE
ncbi:thioredoxin family protein [Dyadobacter tibetensis]|uniref:thioredoxin family protein n=1 Tax=Dyadobacter tibetensis TaxID=1211851 RepID=UPI000471E642|nr:thioredoxin fold domain-containing protein [Dyadobacter tibetensis]